MSFDPQHTILENEEIFCWRVDRGFIIAALARRDVSVCSIWKKTKKDGENSMKTNRENDENSLQFTLRKAVDFIRSIDALATNQDLATLVRKWNAPQSG